MDKAVAARLCDGALALAAWLTFTYLTAARDWPMWKAAGFLFVAAVLWALVEIAVGFVRAARRGTPS